MTDLLACPESKPGISNDRALTRIGTPEADFNLQDLRIFTSVPDHRDYGIATLRGLVLIYDEKPLHVEGIIEGAYYVRESQRPHACRPYRDWLESELEGCRNKERIRVPLKISREVVQAIRWPYAEDWAVRLSSGHVDGPYYDWAWGTDFIGKVVGIYLPGTSKGEC